MEPALTTTQYISQISAIKARLSPYAVAHSILAGDWNFVFEEEDRYDCAGGKFCGRSNEVAHWWDSHLHTMTEWYQGDFTRSGTTRNGTRCLSRLDRVYSNIALADSLDWKISAAVVGALDAQNGRLSDHLPVQVRLSQPRESNQPRPIPAWVAKHSCWQDKVKGRFNE